MSSPRPRIAAPDLRSASSRIVSGASRSVLLFRRGVVDGRWIAWPVAASIVVAAGIAVPAAAETHGDQRVLVAALYLCVGYFAHAYSVAWRTASFLWQFAALVVTLALLGGAAMVHMDHASARVVYPGGRMIVQPPQPELLVAAALNGLTGVLLTVHALILGWGSRAPRMMRAAGTRPAPTAEPPESRGPLTG